MNLPTDLEQRLAAAGIRAGDVEERFVRGSGPGGQKINKSSSTVWLRHRPTGIEVRCQRERSQAANRELAWLELCGKLEARRHATAAAVQYEQQKAVRQNRQKSGAQKKRMVAAKRHRATLKARRARPSEE